MRGASGAREPDELHMRLREVRQAVMQLLALERTLVGFRAAGRRRVVLGLYESPLQAIDELLGLQRALGLAWGRGADALLRAIVAEYQTSDSEVWPAMLIVIFYPVLTGLKRRAKTRFDEDDLDGAVVTCLLSGARALRDLATVDRLPMLVEQETRRRLWQALGADLREAALLRELVPDAHARGRIEPFKGGRSEEQPHATESLALDDLLQELVATVPDPTAFLGGEARGLRELTALLRPDLDPVEQERFYQRVKKRRLRQRARGEATAPGAFARALRDIPEAVRGVNEGSQEQ